MRPAVAQVLSASPPATSSTVVAMPALRSEATSRSVAGRTARSASNATRVAPAGTCSDHVVERPGAHLDVVGAFCEIDADGTVECRDDPRGHDARASPAPTRTCAL